MPITPINDLQAGAGILYVEIGALLSKNLTGIGRFIVRLLQALSRRCELRLVNLMEERLAKHMRLSSSVRTGQQIAILQGTLPAGDSDLDAWRWTLARQPLGILDTKIMQRSPLVYTSLRSTERRSQTEVGILYDFSPALLPWTQTEETRDYFVDFYARSAPLCDRLIAISHSTRRDARWLSGIPADRVAMAYPGASLCVDGHASRKAVARKEKEILVVSTWEPRKNGRFLLDWFGETRLLDPQATLYWVGPRGWLCDPPGSSTLARFPGRRVKFLGPISDKKLCELYRQAAFTIYPSLYEGFGFPVLDSLWHQTPVVCGFHSSLQEFAGPGVYYFDPCDCSS